MDKRRRNVRAALEKIIEKAGDVEVSATAVVSAVAAYAKINANGQWIERSEHVSLNELFDRMTPQEMENYAANGTSPTWFERTPEGMFLVKCRTPVPHARHIVGTLHNQKHTGLVLVEEETD